MRKLLLLFFWLAIPSILVGSEKTSLTPCQVLLYNHAWYETWAKFSPLGDLLMTRCGRSLILWNHQEGPNIWRPWTASYAPPRFCPAPVGPLPLQSVVAIGDFPLIDKSEFAVDLIDRSEFAVDNGPADIYDSDNRFLVSLLGEVRIIDQDGQTKAKRDFGNVHLDGMAYSKKARLAVVAHRRERTDRKETANNEVYELRTFTVDEERGKFTQPVSLYRRQFYGGVIQVVLSPNGRYVAVVSVIRDRNQPVFREYVELFDVTTRESVGKLEPSLREFKPISDHISMEPVVFSPDSKRMAWLSDAGALTVWQIAGSGEPRLKSIGSHTPKGGRLDKFSAVRFSPDSTKLVAMSIGKAFSVWQVSPWRQTLDNLAFKSEFVRPYDNHPNEFYSSIVFSPSGTQIAVLFGNNVLRFKFPLKAK